MNITKSILSIRFNHTNKLAGSCDSKEAVAHQ